MGLMKRTVVVLLVFFGLLFAGQLARGEIYKWVDEKGTTHFTEDPSTIPEKYKDQTRSERIQNDHMDVLEKPGAKQLNGKPAKGSAVNGDTEGPTRKNDTKQLTKELENRLDERRLENEPELKRASDLLNHDSLAQARELLDEITARDPQNYCALKELARYYLRAGYTHSIAALNQGHMYSLSRFTPGTLQRAEALLKRSLSINPNYAPAYVLLAAVYYPLKRFKEAREALIHAEALGNDSPSLHINWANILRATGDTDAAADHCRIAIEKGNKAVFNAAYEGLIYYHEDRKEYNKVEELYQTMFKKDPTYAWGRGNYADFLRTKLGRFDDAIFYAREALRIMDYGVGRETLACSLYSKWADLIVNQKKPQSEAQKYYDEAFRLYPDLDLVMAYEGSHAKGKALVELLKSKGVSVDARAEDGSTALMLASNTGRLDAVRVLLSLGANVNAKSNVGWTALLGAAKEGQLEIVKILLESGAFPKGRVHNKNAVQLAEEHGRADIANLIRQYIPGPDGRGW